MKTVYLDSCIVIYIVEEDPVYSPLVSSLIEETSPAEFAITELVRFECKVRPLRLRNTIIVEQFDRWLDDIFIIDLDRNVFDSAVELRAAYPSISTPDALHLAAAKTAACDEFWTNDQKLKTVMPDLVRLVG